MNLVDLFRIRVSEREHQPAVTFEGRTCTYGELDTASDGMAHTLRRFGLVKGDRVAFYMQNSIELILAYLANLKLGLVTVPMNTQYRDTEITHIVQDSAPRVIIAGAEQRGILEPFREQLASVQHILSPEDLSRAGGAVDAKVGENDLAAIMYTSGTTGRSKGAMLTHGNFVSNITGLVSAWDWTTRDNLLLTLPLFHMHGLGVALHGTLATGCRMVLHPTFRADRVLDELLEGKITLFMGVPTMYVRLLEEAGRLGLAHVELPGMRLFVSGSAPLSVETFQAFEKVFGHKILERYGMTETAMNLSNLYAGPRLPGAVGVPLPGVSARITDEQGRTVPDGEIGQVLIRGSNVFRGYWQQPEKTREAFFVDSDGDRWFRTGDLGMRDPETGYYMLVGRKHDLIISGGFNIYPRELEQVLLSHPAVLEAAVVGVPDAAKGELPVAYIVLREGKLVRGEELAEYCGTHLARYKVPRRITFLDALPRNAMGKVEKKKLKGS